MPSSILLQNLRGALSRRLARWVEPMVASRVAGMTEETAELREELQSAMKRVDELAELTDRLSRLLVEKAR